MRVGIIALQHESNTFLPRATTIEDFRADLLLRGGSIRGVFIDTHHEVGGFLQRLDEAAVEAVPLLVARAAPGGPIDGESWMALSRAVSDAIDRAGPLDGLLVAPHGAAVATGEHDADGAWLADVRRRVGPGVPIICTLDLHANVSARMVAACNATVVYQTNPHVDQRERGREAAELMVRTLRGEIHPVTVARFPRVAINIERQATSEPPCTAIYEHAERLRGTPGILSTSVVLGFPYADVPEMGAAVIVVSDGDSALANRAAAELSAHIEARRESFVGRLIGVEDAVRRAGASSLATGRPACLLDMGDNVGGGAPGDGVCLLRELFGQRLVPSLVCLADPGAQAAARRAGPGAVLPLDLGGRGDQRQGPPVSVRARVHSLHDGVFQDHTARHGGNTQYMMGPTAVVEAFLLDESGLAGATGGVVTVVLNSQPVIPASIGQLTSCGLNPSSFRAIVAKGVHAPAAAYQPVCGELIRANTPGVTCADLARFEYHHRRRPLFPFEREIG